MKHYRQCLLGQNGRRTTAWIETRAAIAGADVEVLQLAGMWRVIKVYRRSMSEDVLKQNQRLNRGSLPSVERMKDG